MLPCLLTKEYATPHKYCLSRISSPTRLALLVWGIKLSQTCTRTRSLRDSALCTGGTLSLLCLQAGLGSTTCSRRWAGVYLFGFVVSCKPTCPCAHGVLFAALWFQVFYNSDSSSFELCDGECSIFASSIPDHLSYINVSSIHSLGVWGCFFLSAG